MTKNPTQVDAGGYMGDWSRGAPLGRPNRGRNTILPEDEADLLAPKFQLQKVRLNGDYDQGGAYWGCHSRGSILYVVFTDTITLYLRAADREAAKQQVRKDYPNARFYR